MPALTLDEAIPVSPAIAARPAPPLRRKLGLLITLLAMVFTFTIATNVNAPPADAASGTCTGAADTNLADAKHRFTQGCGTLWRSYTGQHSCAWGSGGWRCSGPRGTIPWNCHSGESYNSSVRNISLGQAKADYKYNCGQAWNGSTGRHYCSYSNFQNKNNWSCQGPRSR